MTDSLKRVVQRLEALPGDEQDRHAAFLATRLDAYEALKHDLQKGLEEADADTVVAFDADDIIRRGEARLRQASAGDGA